MAGANQENERLKTRAHTLQKQSSSSMAAHTRQRRPAVPSIGEGESPGVFHVAEEAVRGGEGRVLGHEVAVHRPQRQPLEQFRPLRTRHEPTSGMVCYVWSTAVDYTNTTHVRLEQAETAPTVVVNTLSFRKTIWKFTPISIPFCPRHPVSLVTLPCPMYDVDFHLVNTLLPYCCRHPVSLVTLPCCAVLCYLINTSHTYKHPILSDFLYYLVLVEVLPGNEEDPRPVPVERSHDLGRQDAAAGAVMQQDLVGLHVLEGREGLGVALGVLNAAQLLRT